MKALASYFTKGLLIDLETNEEVTGYTQIKIYGHFKNSFLLPREAPREIIKTKLDLKVAYNLDEKNSAQQC